MGFPGASQVYRPLPGIPEGLDSPLAFLLVATALNAGLAGRPGMQLSWWVGLHLGNGAQSRARPVTQEPPSGLCPAQSFPGTSALLSFGRESVSEREGLGVLGCWGLRFQLCCKSRGCSVVGNGEGHPPPFSGALRDLLHVGILSRDGLDTTRSQAEVPRESEPRGMHKVPGLQRWRHGLPGGLLPPWTPPVSACDRSSWPVSPCEMWTPVRAGMGVPGVLVGCGLTHLSSCCRLIPPLNQLELLRNLESKSGLTFRWAGASMLALIPHGSMRASRGAQAGLRPLMAQNVHILLP